MDGAPIVQVALQRGAHSLVRYRGPAARGLQERISVRLIEEVLRQKVWPRGIYCFTSLDGMNPEQLAAARALWSFLKSRPDCFAPLNDPSRVIGRYKLLRALHERGMNDFNVHLVHDLDAVRYPAFVRYEFLHRANLTDLVRSRAELEDALAGLLLRGERAEDLIVTEWLDYRDEDGLYRKYGVHICGEKVLAKHLFVGQKWMMKIKNSHRRWVKGEEYEHVLADRHLDLVRPAFEISGCDWARMDYSFYRGRLQVWEINDNPELGKRWKNDIGRLKTHQVFFPRFEKALDEVSARVQLGPGLEWAMPSSTVVGR